MDHEIFKAYDIRGVYPDQLDDQAAYRIGAAFARSGLVPLGGKVAVGRDMRLSSDALFAALTQGLTDAGVNVIDIGRVTTPMLYFGVNVLAADGGVMITASHNPVEYNGFKLVRAGAIPISGDTGLTTVRDLALGDPPVFGPRGKIYTEDIRPRYREFFKTRFSVEFSRPVIIDAGNGMAGAILPVILADQRINYTEMYFTPDGRFPHHEANPLKEENLSDLRRALASTPGAIGVAFDGDADRVAFLDEQGTLVRGDLLTALVGGHLLDTRGPGTIIYDLRSSRIVPEVIRAHGGKPVKTRVGHSFIKALMRKEQAMFAGELSFHFYFSDFFYCESGISMLLLVMSLLAQTETTLTALIRPLGKYAHSGEINFRVKEQTAAMDAVEKHFSTGEISHLDGLSVDFPDWWFNLRPSNTEPLLRLNVEAKDKPTLQEKLTELTRILKKFSD